MSALHRQGFMRIVPCLVAVVVVGALSPLLGRKKRESLEDAIIRVIEKQHAVRGARFEIRDGKGQVLRTGESRDWALSQRMGDELRSKLKDADVRMSNARLHVVKTVTGCKTQSWSFKTNIIVESETLKRGEVRISDGIAADFNMQPGIQVVIRHGVQSVRLTLLTSSDLERPEVELNKHDLAALGLMDGASGYLEVMSEDQPLLDRTPSSGTSVTRRSRARKQKAPSNRVMRTDNDTPPYVVDSGLKFWKRRGRI